MKLPRKIRFWLGLPVVAKLGDSWVVTKRVLGSRYCLSKTGDFWWMTRTAWLRLCAHDTLESAEIALDRTNLRSRV